MLSDNPELALWDYCDHKTYPFFRDPPCDCRRFVLVETVPHTFVQNNYTNDNFNGIFKHWTNLEIFRLELLTQDFALFFNDSQMFRVYKCENIYLFL